MNYRDNKIELEKQEIESIISDPNNKSSTQKHFFQIDVMKTISIVCVVISHSLSRFYFNFEVLWQVLRPVELFILLLGFNQGNSFKRTGFKKLGEMYTSQYFKKMLWRIIFPLIIVDLFCWGFDLLVYYFNGFHIQAWSNAYGPIYGDVIDLGTANPPIQVYMLLGVPFFPGPGEYYITILIQFILIFPLLYKLFDKDPKLGLITCFLIEFGFQIAAKNIPILNNLFEQYHFLFCGSIFRYFSLIGFGLYFINNADIFSKKNAFIWPLLIFALYFISGAGIFTGSHILPSSWYPEAIFELKWGTAYGIKFFRTDPWWQSANLFTYPYTAFLFLFIMKILPSTINEKKKVARSISKSFKFVSKLTYHILLVQMVYYFIAIPLEGVFHGPNGTFYDLIVVPIVKPYLDSLGNLDISALDLNIAILLLFGKLLVGIINVIISISFAYILYKFCFSIEKRINVEKPISKIIKSEIAATS